MSIVGRRPRRPYLHSSFLGRSRFAPVAMTLPQPPEGVAYLFASRWWLCSLGYKRQHPLWPAFL